VIKGAVEAFPVVEAEVVLFEDSVTVAEEPVFASEVTVFEVEGVSFFCAVWFAVCCGCVGVVVVVVVVSGVVREGLPEFC
jgi:hypothetical protein